jgi:hypothetical protein
MKLDVDGINTLNKDNDVLRFTIILRLSFLLINGYIDLVY